MDHHRSVWQSQIKPMMVDWLAPRSYPSLYLKSRFFLKSLEQKVEQKVENLLEMCNLQTHRQSIVCSLWNWKLVKLELDQTMSLDSFHSKKVCLFQIRIDQWLELNFGQVQQSHQIHHPRFVWLKSPIQRFSKECFDRLDFNGEAPTPIWLQVLALRVHQMQTWSSQLISSSQVLLTLRSLFVLAL